ncbi:mycofactocin biosynthesis chaperone MftB [Streptomyces sp. NPDC004542]|uniref:mycofactocin biosynthesis chaperone MftB n=1 Tax=Streptomyces sp. NPDC004542 TaxID=3154281 RepID=UPI0033A87A4B
MRPGPVGFDPSRPHRCSPSVAVRAEAFGALVYHFGTRRLCFLKSPELVRIVQSLADFADVHSALDAAGVADARRNAYLRTLGGLADSGVIEPRSGARDCWESVA